MLKSVAMFVTISAPGTYFLTKFTIGVESISGEAFEKVIE